MMLLTVGRVGFTMIIRYEPPDLCKTGILTTNSGKMAAAVKILGDVTPVAGNGIETPSLLRSHPVPKSRPRQHPRGTALPKPHVHPLQVPQKHRLSTQKASRVLIVKAPGSGLAVLGGEERQGRRVGGVV
jgi:hypothetical protein